MIRVTLAVALVTSGCGRRETPPPAADPTAPVARAPADTMVLVTRSGASVWLAEGRDAKDSAGVGCYERSVEIRSDSSTIKVPLLFVTRAPTELGQGQIRAELSRNCRVMALYRVELATGRPTKLEDR